MTITAICATTTPRESVVKKFEVNFIQKKVYMTAYVNADSVAQAKSIVVSHEGNVKFDSVKEVA